MNNDNKALVSSTLARMEERDPILDRRSVVIGLAVVACLFVGAAAWKLATAPEKKQSKIPDMVFSPEPPKIEEKFEFKEPLRPSMREVVDDRPTLSEDEHKINIQRSTNPQEVQFKEDVIKTPTLEPTPDVDLKAVQLAIQDTMEKADEISTESVDPLAVIAALTTEPADLYKYDEVKVSDARKVGLISTAPRIGNKVQISPERLGDQNAPTMGELGPVDINIFGDGLGNGLGRGGNRFETRTAVDAALHWLAIHQEPDGSWIGNKWDADDVKPDGGLPPGSKSEGGGKEGSVAAVAFPVLAFMGGGHNLRRGEYRANVIRATEWLLAKQDPNTGYLSKNMYEHAIVTIALCEAFGRSPDERVGLAARSAVAACVSGVAKGRGGWRYSPGSDDADVSVSSWFLQALKTAKLANIKFDHTVFSRGLSFIDQSTDKGAMAGSSGAVGYQPTDSLDQSGNPNPALTCAGMIIRQFNGMGVNHPLLVGGAALTRKGPPDWNKKDFYYWYYATYAMHNMGGENRLWWNRRIRDVLLDHQSKRGHHAGSWNPKGERWLNSRVMATSVGALCLEVYYRYGDSLQSFGTVPNVEELFFK